MFCEKCGNQIREGNRFCPNCGAKTTSAFSSPASFDDNAEQIRNTRTDRPFGKAVESIGIAAEQNPAGNQTEQLREMFRQEAEQSVKRNDARKWADAALIFGILSICFIAVGAGVFAIFFAFFFGVKSNRAADSAGIPREKKAKTGMMLACVPVAVGILAGTVVGILALCGVFG